MAFNTFGQAWRQKAFTIEPDERLHVADPSHMERSPDPNPTWEAPADLHEQPDFLYDSDAVVDDWLADSTGQVLNTTPVDHQDGGDFGVTTSPTETAAVNAATAGRDYGASRQSNYTVPPFQDSSTRYINPRFEGLPATPVAPVALVRGLNSDPANNPDGFRRGWVEQTFVDRRLYVGERVHDRRWVTPNTAYAETTNQAPVGGTSGSPYGSLARAFQTIGQRPMIRREPVSISESVTTDGSEEYGTYDEQPGDWVAG